MTNNAVVQLFAYDEPDVITSTMDQYAETPVPEHWSIDYQAWVTPAESHQTVEAAKRHPQFSYMSAPKGKLATRNTAHNWAFNRSYDVVITADADEPPFRDDYFAELLAPFQRGSVLAVTGWPKNTGLSAPVTTVARRLDETRRPIRANCSALSEIAWRYAGPFRVDDVDQTDITSVRREEEFDFRRRIEDVGEVVEQRSAQVHANNRRMLSKVYDALSPLGGSDLGHAASRGAKTFAPAEKRDDSEQDK